MKYQDDPDRVGKRPYIPPPIKMHVHVKSRIFCWFSCLGLLLILLNLVSGIADSPLAYAVNVPHTITLKGAPSTPNTLNPTAGSTSQTRTFPPAAPGNEKPHAPVSIGRNTHMPMQAGSVALHVNAASHFLGSDGRLEVQIPAGAISTQDLAAAGGAISVRVMQVAPASGSLAGGSGEISLGTYLVQLLDVHGKLLTHGLRKPLTVRYHLQAHELGLGLEHAFVLLNGAVASDMLNAQGAVLPTSSPTLVSGQTSTSSPSFASTLGPQQKQPAHLDLTAKTLTVTPQTSTPSMLMSFDSDSPIATFGKPDPTSVDLSAGSLSYSEPIALPAGPGGLTPPVNLTYSSEGVNGQHNASAAVGWVGEGWNLSLGSINWNEQNVTSGCNCTANWESTWQLNDPYGTSSEIIPPNINVSTFYDDTPNFYCATGNPNAYPCPILWHTATESHAKIYAYVGPLNIGQPVSPPCFRVWLPNGIMEEFGCTLDSLQYYYEDGLGALVTAWNLDLITDLQGNQIHVTYQQDMENWTSPSTGKTYSYPRDTQLASIQYDSPNCHNAQTVCTGSSWAPQMQVVFNASHNVANLTGIAPTGCNTGGNLRCDDPVDLSGNNGYATSLIQSTFVLNSMQVQVRTSGTGSWNTLNTYNLSYEQSGPTTTTDPSSGISRSTAGMLDLTQIKTVGSDGTTALPLVSFGYTSQTNYYVDSSDKPNPTTNCGPSWNTGNGSGCPLWSQSYANGDRYLASISNGQGLAQTFSWSLAHNNTHGVNGGGSNNANPFYCNGNQGSYPCNEADDMGWSHVVLTQENTTTVRVTQAGQVGAQNDLVNFHGTNDNNWNNVQSATVTVSLNAGDNTLLFSNPSGWAPNIDRITVNGTSYEAEAAGNTLIGGAKVQGCSACSGGQEVGFVGNGGTLRINNVNVASAGSYALTIFYVDGDAGRSAQVTVNGTNTPVISTTNYTYQLTYPLPAQRCSDCVAGMYWGNQNDGDFLNYFNAKFMGFAQTTVALPSGAVEVHKYYAGEGWGIYDTSQVQCFSPSPCHNDPWWDLANAAHGQEYQAQYYDTDGTTLLKQVNTTLQAVCPPSGVSGTPASSTWGNWNGHLVSSIEHNNPVAVCDIHQMQQTTQTYDGASNPVTATSNWTYDSFGRVTQETTTSNGGTPSQVVHNTSYIWNDGVTATQNSASGTYIINKVAFADTEDGSGNRLACSYTSFDGQSYTTGQTSSLTGGLATTATNYANCGTSGNGYTPSNPSTTTSTYDVYGDAIGSNDADANAGISGHTGCSINGVQHTVCTTYDSTFSVFPIVASNALNQSASTSYANTGQLFGFGTWPVSTTDANNQTTSSTYDALGRITGTTLPGETSGDLTKQWVYTNWCSGTATQAPCEEIDEIDRLNSSTTTTTRAFYDGLGRLVETRTPGPVGQDIITYATYDTSGRQIAESNPYFVTAYTGTPGAAAYSIPDSTQPGSSTSYPNLRQINATDPNSHTTTSTASVICGVPGTSDMGCYVQAMMVDANGHESATLMGGLAKTSYTQRYTGTSGSYALYATTSYTYDAAGRLLLTISPDGTTTTETYDNLGRVTNQNDPDHGTITVTYDPNSNPTQMVDARGSTGTVFAGYDGLNRTLWHNSTNSPTGAWVSYTYDSTANGNNGIGQLTSESFTGSGGLTGGYTFTYDARGQVASNVMTVNGTNYPTQAAYNDAGMTTSITYPTGEVVTSGYDANGWLLGLNTQSGSTITTLASNLTYAGLAGAAGQITSMALGSGDTYAASYDTGMRLTSTSLTQANNNALVYQSQPAYDAANNVVNVQTNINGQTDTQQFCYDSLNRMTWAGATGMPPCASLTPGTLTAAQYQQSDSYNVDGGLINGPNGSYTYGVGSQPHRLLSTSNGYSAAYDATGNMICRAPDSSTACSDLQTGQQLSYDAEGRLTSWQNQPTSPTSMVNYLYDGSGNRVAMQATVSGTTTTTAYIGDTEEIQTTGSTTQTTTYYTVGGQRIAANVNGTFYYFGYDALGSQVVVLNSNGLLVGSQLYGPFGNQRYSSGTLPTSIGFTGQHADSVTGLDYYNARYYDPVAGVFLSPDNVQGNAQGMEPYAYVGGNPETLTDPTGHDDTGDLVSDFGYGGTVTLPDTGPDTGPLNNPDTGPLVNPVDTVTMGDTTYSYDPNTGDITETTPTSGAVASPGDPNYNQFQASYQAALNANDVTNVPAVNSHILNKYRPASHSQNKAGPGATTSTGSGGGFGGGGGGSGGSPATSAGGECSFTPDTQVMTDQGEKALGDLQVGEKVMAYNPKTHKMEAEPILHVWKHSDNDLIDLTLTSETPAHDGKPASKTSEVLHTTSEHPFLTTEQGFTPAGQLKVGMHVLRADGSVGVVTDWKVVPGTKEMYNLEVQQDHTFTVGAGEWVVHNRCNPGQLGRNLNRVNPTNPGQLGQNPHHIIPCALENHPLLQLGGFDINDPHNGRYLWDYNHRLQALSVGEPYHANAPSYLRLARSLLDDAYQGLTQFTQAEAQSAIGMTIDQLNGAINFQGAVGVLEGTACPLPGL